MLTFKNANFINSKLCFIKISKNISFDFLIFFKRSLNFWEKKWKIFFRFIQDWPDLLAYYVMHLIFTSFNFVHIRKKIYGLNSLYFCWRKKRCRQKFFQDWQSLQLHWANEATQVFWQLCDKIISLESSKICNIFWGYF